MAITSGFFMSIDGDRKYKADFFAQYFATFIGNGVFPNPATNLQLIANNDMTVTVKPGKAWINGYVVFNDNDYILNLTPADGVLNRIDRVVLRWDLIDREIKVVVKQGAFASGPVAPELQRDVDAYELALADIAVNKGAISITQANIKDLRLNKELCGIVHGVVDQVDTTTLFNQYQAWQIATKEEFDVWFDSIKDILEGDVAANLASRISALEQDFGMHLADNATIKHKGKEIGLEDTSNNFTNKNVEGAMTELFTNVSDGKELVGGAITDVDDSVVIPTDPTFNDLANAIGSISTGMKFAGGSSLYTDYSNDGGYLQKVNLSFKPEIILTWRITSTSSYAPAQFGIYVDVNLIRRVTPDNQRQASISLTCTSYPRLVESGFNVTSDSFQLRQIGRNGKTGDVWAWIAFGQ